MGGLVLRRATPADTEGIAGLLASVFPKNPKSDPDVLYWQYWTNPLAPAFSWVWEDEGKIVCHYAGLPVMILVAGRRTIGLLGVDAATHDDYRERGLFSQLTVEALAYGASSPAPVTLGFQNPLTTVPAPTEILRDVFDLYVAPLRVTRKQASHRVEDLPDGLDDLWQEVVEAYPYGIVKDAEWWKWRYGDHPRAPYSFFSHFRKGHLRGFAVAKLHPRRRIVQLLDLLAVNRPTARRLLASIRRSFGNTLAVTFRASRSNPGGRLVRACGLVRVPARLDRKAPRWLVAPHTEELRELERAPWSVSWGDMDTL